ncbi:unnamed protein product, partial [Hapterophycus canaliculatus]
MRPAGPVTSEKAATERSCTAPCSVSCIRRRLPRVRTRWMLRIEEGRCPRRGSELSLPMVSMAPLGSRRKYRVITHQGEMERAIFRVECSRECSAYGYRCGWDELGDFGGKVAAFETLSHCCRRVNVYVPLSIPRDSRQICPAWMALSRRWYSLVRQGRSVGRSRGFPGQQGTGARWLEKQKSTVSRFRLPGKICR